MIADDCDYFFAFLAAVTVGSPRTSRGTVTTVDQLILQRNGLLLTGGHVVCHEETQVMTSRSPMMGEVNRQ